MAILLTPGLSVWQKLLINNPIAKFNSDFHWSLPKSFPLNYELERLDCMKDQMAST